MPVGSVCAYENCAGWESEPIEPVVGTPSRRLVDCVVVRFDVNDARARGSHVPNARVMAFLGVSTESIWIWMSVLFSITSAR